ncbi:MAG: N-acetylmuramoyl-L-alanine amidase [Paraclostridium sp.]
MNNNEVVLDFGHGGEGEELAIRIGSALKSIGQTNIKTYSRKGSTNTDYYAVIRGTKMKSVIVEVCFIDNLSDRQIADTKEKRIRNGIEIAHGILNQIGISIK